MKSNRKTTRIAGVLFIIATVASSLDFAILDPILNAHDLLLNVPASETQMIVEILLMLIYVVAAVDIAIMLDLILKKYSEAMAHGYVAARLKKA